MDLHVSPSIAPIYISLVSDIYKMGLGAMEGYTYIQAHEVHNNRESSPFTSSREAFVIGNFPNPY